jgi:putative ABC transport system permease protein
MVDLALKTLLHDKIRFAITVSGVAFAVMLIVVQAGLFLGLLEKATITIDRMDADIWITSRNTPNVDFAHAFPETYLKRVRSVPGVARADNLIVQFMTIALPTGAEESVVLYAMENFSPWHFPWNMVEGDTADLRRGNYLILDDYAAKRFGPFKVGDHREIFDTRLKIIGRSKEALSFTTTPMGFLDYRLIQDLSPDRLRGKTTYIVVKLVPGADRAQVQAELRRRLPFNDVHTREEWSQKTCNYWVSSTGIGVNMLMTVFLGCLVGVVVVAQTLYTSTIEHLKEFATVKAIGGSNADIYRILLKQASIAAVAGYLAGVIPAFGLQPLVSRMDLKLIITPEMLAIVFVGTLLLCQAAGAISFRKVAGADPAMVFRG